MGEYCRGGPHARGDVQANEIGGDPAPIRLALRRLESGDVDKNEMRIIFHLIRLGCRPGRSVQVSATKISKALGMQTVRVGAILRELCYRASVAGGR